MTKSVMLMDMDLPDLGTRLRDARTAAGVSARVMAEALSLDPSIYSRTELGKRGLRAEELVLAARRLNMSIDELVSPTGDPTAEARRAATEAYGEAALAVYGLALALHRLGRHGAVDLEELESPTYTAIVGEGEAAGVCMSVEVLLRRAVTVTEGA